MTLPRKPRHGGKRPGAGRPRTDRTARLVVRVAPDVLEAARKACGGGQELADEMRLCLRWLGGERVSGR